MPDARRPAQYFNPDFGLMARRAADDVLKHRPLRIGADRLFWGYSEGLWTLAEDDVSKIIVRLLDERYRPHHETAIQRVLRATVPDLPENPTENKINMSNGMLHWSNAPDAPELLPHHEFYLSAVQLPVRWKDDAECPQFDEFVEQCVAADDRQRLWEIIGYLMMWGNPLQRMFLLTGPGGNGKGVLLAVIKALLGQRNCAAVPLYKFVEDRFAPADLYGRLANISGDIDAEYLERTGQIKELSGEDTIRAEEKGKKAFNFQFQGKSIFSANGLPSSSDASVGWLRRWEVVDFPNAPARPDRGLKSRLTRQGELEGIARKAVYALRELMARGDFERGASAARVHETFAQKSNKVLLWLDETCVRVPGTHYDRRELLKRFRMWDAFENPASRPMGSQTFYDRLRAIAWVRELTRNGVRGFGEFRFRDEVSYGAVIGEEPAETAPGRGVQIEGQYEIAV
jgi:putative DNA primase/helicase